MRIKFALPAPLLCLIGLIIAALVILAQFGTSASAKTPSPSPSPSASPTPTATPSPSPSPSPSPIPPVHFTDVGVSVVKEEQITTQEGVTSTHGMTITVTNGNYPADVHLTVLAVSKLGVCEARLIPVGGDGYIEFQTDENNDGILDTLYSELDIDLNGMAVGEARTLQRSYSLVCNVASPPLNPYEIQADVLPQLPVQEANLGNPPPCPSPWCVPAVTGGPQTPSDNVDKNFPNIIIATPTPGPTAAVTPTPTPTPACPGGIVPPWLIPSGDLDCDGFTSSAEIFIGTDPTRACGPNAWPPDINNDQTVNLLDVFKIVPVLNTADNAPGSSTRFDLNTDGNINLSDVFKIVPFLNTSCAP
jgi:Dockerin type I domain